MRLALLVEEKEEGVVLLSRAIDLLHDDDAEDLADLHTKRGLLRVRLRQLDDALVDFDRAISLHDRCAPAYYYRADVFLVQEEYLRALHNYERFFELHNDFYSSRADFDPQSFTDATVLDFCVKKAACYSGMKDWEMVRECCDIVLQQEMELREKQPRFLALAHYYAGKAAEGGGLTQEAIQHWNTSLSFGLRLDAAIEGLERLKKD
jgi:tetratricopeptide (TPR) repeat protein